MVWHLHDVGLLLTHRAPRRRRMASSAFATEDQLGRLLAGGFAQVPPRSSRC
jgi:hypothetical protein